MLLKPSLAEIVERFWEIWARRDRAAAVTFLAEDVVYAIYVPEDVLPFGGVTRGKASVSDRWQTILDVFETDHFAGRVLRQDGNEVHGRVDFVFRHKLTQQVIDGSVRQRIVFRDSKIVEWHDYLDTERVRAFMQFVAYTANRQEH